MTVREPHAVVRGQLPSWAATPADERIVATMIVRDEEASLPRCLASLVPWIDELVVLDTGSADATVSIAEAHGARVGHFIWCDSFAAARNAALSLATAPWVLIIDADETLCQVTASGIREVIRSLRDHTEPICVSAIVRSHWVDEPGVSVGPAPTIHRGGRLFRRLPDVYWIGDVHETVTTRPGYLGAPIRYIEAESPVIDHYGYASTRETLAKKNTRNLTLLHRAYERDHANGYYAYKLAQHAIAVHDAPETLRWLRLAFAEGIEAPNPARFLASATDLLVRALIEQASALSEGPELIDLLAEAEHAIVRSLTHFPEFVALWLRLAEIAVRRNDLPTASKTYRAILDREPDHFDALIGYASSLVNDPVRAIATLDHILARHGARDTVAAWRGELLRSQGNVQQSYDFLYETVTMHPDFLQTRVTLANLLDDAGAPTEAIDLLGVIIDRPDVPASAYDILGRAFMRLGQREAAANAIMMAATMRNPVDDATA